MKNTKKILLGLLVLLSALIFVSCSSNDDEKENVTTVATFYGVTAFSVDTNGEKIPTTLQITIYFFSDKTYNLIFNVVATGNGKVAAERWTEETGTYTGDPRLNGKITVTTCYEYNKNTKKLDPVNPSTETVEIINGQITIGEDGDSITLTRQ